VGNEKALSNQMDEEDIDERGFFHTLDLFYPVSLLTIAVLYIVLHLTLSMLMLDFHLMNPICLLLAIDFGSWMAKTLYMRHFNLQPDNILLSITLLSITIIACLLQISLNPQNSLELVELLYHQGCGSFLLSSLLCSILIVIHV
jgi:uncharacterized membrane protein